MHPRGFIQIKDRSKDVIKSGGEWISSVELENALMAHPAIAEAAVIAVPDAKWDERPLAAVVLREGQTRDRGRAARVPRAELRQVVAARAVRVHRRRSRRRASASSARRSCARCSPRRQCRRDQDGLARQPAGERGQRGDHRDALVGARDARRRRPRRRPARQGRARVLGRRRHRRLRRTERPTATARQASSRSPT